MFTYVHLCMHNICIKVCLFSTCSCKKVLLLCIHFMYTCITRHNIQKIHGKVFCFIFISYTLYGSSRSRLLLQILFFFFCVICLNDISFALRTTFFSWYIRYMLYYLRISWYIWAYHVTYYIYQSQRYYAVAI